MLGPKSERLAVVLKYGFNNSSFQRIDENQPCMALFALEFVLARNSRPNGFVKCSHSKNQICCLEAFTCSKLDSPCSLIKGCGLSSEEK